MFIKRNRTVLAGKDYQSILLVQGKRVPAKRPPGRPAAGSPAPKSVVVHETLANLSKLPPDLIELIERHCKEPSSPLASPCPPASGSEAASAIHLGPCYGVLAALDGLAREMGLVQAVGEQSPSTAELVRGLKVTFQAWQECLERWTPEDLAYIFRGKRWGKSYELSRQWVIWHVIEHDLHHGGELSFSLGAHGLAAPDL